MARSRRLPRRGRHGRFVKNALRKAGAKRKYHSVKRHPRSGTTVKKHMSNPRRRRYSRRARRNPFGLRIPSMGGVMGGAQQAVIGLAALFGSLYVTGIISRQGDRFLPMLPSWANKALAGVVTVMVANRFIKSSDLQRAVLYGAALPVVAEGAMRFVPGIAGQVPMLAAAAMPSLPMMSAAPAGQTVSAELMAELEQESEASLY